jgi:hypothetical protein
MATAEPSSMAAKPDSKQVEDFHTNDDVDVRSESHHHTLGYGRTQAALGDHNHQNGNGAPIFEGMTVTGSKGGNTALGSLLAVLVQFGLTDSTTP